MTNIPMEQDMSPEEIQLEDDVLNAIMGDNTVELTVQIGPKGRETELTLKFRWPDAEDEQAIQALTTRFCNGMPPELLSDADFELARARAVIEALTEGPYEGNDWLPPTESKVMFKGKMQLRPNTGKVKSRGILTQFGRKWYETYTRFQYLVAGQ